MKGFGLGLKLANKGGEVPSADHASSKIISVAEACEMLGISRSTLYKLIRIGEIPAFKLSQGGRWRFERRDLEVWLDDRKSAEAPPIRGLE